MKHPYDDEALDRVLFGLALEEPPAGLRASILAATAYRPVAPFSVLDLTLIGTLMAMAAWLVALFASGGGSPVLQAAGAYGLVAVHALSNVAVLTWLAAGAATAVWLSLFTGPQLLAPARQRSEWNAPR